jgi:hypothetical protein
MLEIGMALGDGSIGTDIVVTRPEEFAWRKQIVGTIEYPAAREGKIVYARSQAANFACIIQVADSTHEGAHEPP